MNIFTQEPFNARNFTPAEVASTFVSNAEYWELWGVEHAVLLGPRGSGKTTIMKMLTLSGIRNWSHHRAHQIIKSLPFSAVYIPTDMHWRHQMRTLDRLISSSPLMAEIISKANVTVNVMMHLCRTFQERIDLEDLDPAKEAEILFARKLARAWELDPDVPSLGVLMGELGNRVARIRRELEKLQSCVEIEIKNLPEFFFIDFYSAIETGCIWFDETFKQVMSSKWALCFDELELAPTWLQVRLFDLLRSSNEKFLFKLSTSPIPITSGGAGASPRNDFRVIRLWDHEKKSYQDFCEKLTRGVLRRVFDGNVDPTELFGSFSPLGEEDGKNSVAGAYNRDSAEYRIIKEVGAWDSSVATELRKHGINPDDPFTSDISKRDSVLRKAKPLIEARKCFLKPLPSGEVIGRSRKNPGIFHGRDTIYRTTDGNPRRLIEILEGLVKKVVVGKGGKPLPIPPRVQSEALQTASRRFWEYNQGLSEATVKGGDVSIHISELIKALGSYVHRAIVRDPFTLDPAASFRVDEGAADASMLELLRVAIYHGALSYVDPPEGCLETDVKSRRLRLSYTLAPYFQFPLRLYSDISLSKVLQRMQGPFKRKLVKFRETLVDQPELPLS